MANVISVVDAEFVPLLSLNAQTRCYLLEPRTGSASVIDTNTIFKATEFVVALRNVASALQSRKRAFVETSAAANSSAAASSSSLAAIAAVAAATVENNRRDVRSEQEIAYAESLAVDRQRSQVRDRLQVRRNVAIARRDERQKRVIGLPAPCAVRVRLPNGALIESVFDRDADQVAALLDFVVIEASMQLGDAFDIANYQLFSLYPKRCVAGELASGETDPSAALALSDAVAAAAGADRRVLLVLEER